MLVLWGIGIAAVLLFGFTVLFGAPFLPTLANRTNDALDLLDLKPGELLLELGSGDGRLQRAAAKRGIHSIGYELNPLLVIYSKVVLWRYRKLAKVRLANYWQVTLPKAQGIYVFLLQPYMQKLHNKITKESNTPVKIVSFAFTIPNKKPVLSKQGMHLYLYK
jgi:16S rRNA A1518/A1519 N6-dimethyltransferase RsmA/KsgA/DIM1 with predicted DNA glycosylase/AP lyase activity